jgi:hypothetical protein
MAVRKRPCLSSEQENLIYTLDLVEKNLNESLERKEKSIRK